jgi:hypothetical protein
VTATAVFAEPPEVSYVHPRRVSGDDGRRPSEFAELYGFTRAVTQSEGKWLVKWPVIAPVSSGSLPLLEDWTLTVNRVSADKDSLFQFALTGSKTGPDGTGRSDARFVSTSRRVVIETDAWNVPYALSLGGIHPVPERFEVKWHVEPHFVDEFMSPGVSAPAVETSVTLAQGLSNAAHTLEITGSESTPLTALRVYHPPMDTERHP